MDYMNLGVRSRKTGLNVKQNLQKDEYSMENIDDFFKDDDTSLISARRKSRRSSLLSAVSNGNIVSTPIIEKEQLHSRNNKELKVPLPDFGPKTKTSLIPQYTQRQGPRSPSPQNMLGTIVEDEVHYDDYEIDNYSGAANQEIQSNLPQRKYTTEYDDNVSQDNPSIRLTPEKPQNKDFYKDVPDLIEDDEDTRDFTSFNTSENALLEDELDDDYRVESEEDGDYVEGESSLDDLEGNVDDESIDNTDSDDSDAHQTKRLNLYSGAAYGYQDNSPSEVYDSDEEYIQNQAPHLIENDSALRPNGTRRSNRVKIAPLEYWRNEKVVYKKKSNKPVLEIDKIITYDHNDDEDEEEEVRGNRKKKKKSLARTRPYNYIPTGRPRGRPKKQQTSTDWGDPNTELLEEINSGSVQSAEWLKHGILEANVNISIDKTSDEIVAFAPSLAQSEQTKETDEESFSLEIMFDKHKDHFASGMLKLPRGGKKKLSDSYNAFINFFVVKGILEVSLGGTVFLVTQGSSFQIPAFNKYAFQNMGNDEVNLFFVQVTVPEPIKEDDTSDESNEAGGIAESMNDEKSNNETSANKASSLSNMSISEI